MPFRRVRPVRRMLVGGAVAGAAYKAGQRKTTQQYDEQTQDARLDRLESQAAPAAPAPAPEAPMGNTLDELKKLAELREMGVLTDEEFAAQKARILGG